MFPAGWLWRTGTGTFPSDATRGVAKRRPHCLDGILVPHSRLEARWNIRAPQLDHRKQRYLIVRFRNQDYVDFEGHARSLRRRGRDEDS